MGVWTQINGTIEIPKKEKVSIKQVIEEVYTDELRIVVQTTDKGDYYHHNLDCCFETDGNSFVERLPEFLKNLKPRKGGLDIECVIRLLN